MFKDYLQFELKTSNVRFSGMSLVAEGAGLQGQMFGGQITDADIMWKLRPATA